MWSISLSTFAPSVVLRLWVFPHTTMVLLPSFYPWRCSHEKKIPGSPCLHNFNVHTPDWVAWEWDYILLVCECTSPVLTPKPFQYQYYSDGISNKKWLQSHALAIKKWLFSSIFLKVGYWENSQYALNLLIVLWLLHASCVCSSTEHELIKEDVCSCAWC